MNLHEKVGRRNRIKAFIEEGLFDDAAEEVKEELMKALLKTDFDQKDVRNDIYVMIKAFDELRQRLQSWVDDGFAAEEELKHLEQVEKDERDQD